MFETYHLGQGASIVTAVPGARSRALLALQQQIEGRIVSYPIGLPIAIKNAKGAIVQDVDGNRFIDFFSGAGVLNVGHCNPDVLSYVEEQQKELIHMLDFPTENKLEFINSILSFFPENTRGEFKVSFCGPTGSDGVEAAIKLAKHKTGRSAIIAFQGSYHGMTAGALSLTSNTRLREKFGSLVPDVSFIPYSYCYRCPYNKNEESCQLDCAGYLETLLNNPHSGFSKPAAIILEPIQGEGGTIVPKDGFLERIIKIARKNDILVIFDEVQCGFFRTGKFLESLKLKTLPDILVMSKGLGGIGFPISAIIYNKTIESWDAGDHIGTFRGNQVSIAAGRGALAFVKQNNLEEHTLKMGRYLINKLKEICTWNPYLGEVRGSGLIIGIEYVKDKKTKEPYPELVKELKKISFENGLLFEIGGHFNNVIRFLPPLIINEEIIENAMQIFELANRAVLKLKNEGQLNLPIEKAD
ncbi:aspartate aminotransferase family protein [Pedobacter sp. D749]|uniref:aspartate aminotransferase family protein n=1 Tax=Pedobacter sp. D749 TaxID=2856523 RepID=UPI001C56040D|nr:aspartate aminotransferase family protein [Pedobacter sp. D749]QXU43272.1 aspartate aminotransferase family protein [Pedobacter sp. D749]